MSEHFDIAVAGGGIAGLSAGLAAARLGRRTLIIAGDVLGGNLLSIEKVEGYPGFEQGVPGYELCPLTQVQASEAGAEFVSVPLQSLEREGAGFRLVTGEGEYTADAVVIASGCDMKTLGVPGEDLFKGKGVSHCASCDAPMLRERTVVVVGGGDSAMQEALTLAAHVAKVILLVREETLGGQDSYRQRVTSESRIEVRFGVEVQEILGSDAVTGVRLKGVLEPLATDAVFAYVGLSPNTAFLNGLVGLDGDGRISTDGSLAASVQGVFAAGTVRAGSPGRAAASAGDGTTAAIAAHRFLLKGRA